MAEQTAEVRRLFAGAEPICRLVEGRDLRLPRFEIRALPTLLRHAGSSPLPHGRVIPQENESRRCASGQRKDPWRDSSFPAQAHGL